MLLRTAAGVFDLSQQSYSASYCSNARLLFSCLYLQLFTISREVEFLDDTVKEVRYHDFSTFKSSVTSFSLAGFLSLRTIDFSDWIILCYEGLVCALRDV